VRSLAAAGLVLAALACTHAATPREAATPTKSGSEVRVEVTNHYSLSAELYAVAAGVKQRLGTVNPGVTRAFLVPPGMLGAGPVSIIAEIINENPVVSGGLQLVPGDVVEFEIAMHLIASTARVRGRP
jgi:hypothetical protein